MGSIIGRNDSTERQIIILPEDVKRLFEQVEQKENGSVVIHRMSLQELHSICLAWKDKRQTMCLSPEVIDLLLTSVQGILSGSTPISTPTEKTSTSTPKHIKAESTSDSPAQTRPTVRVDIVVPLPSGATKNFLSALRYKMKQQNMSFVECSIQQLNEDDNNDTPALVVCNNHSRLLADIQNTLTNVQSARHPRIILLVVHCQKEKHLPALSALAQLKETSDFKELRDVLDIAFDQNDGVRGIYDCDMNKRAFDVLQEMSSTGYFSDVNDIENYESRRKKIEQKDEGNQQK